jgi:hypothetical protein
MTINLVMLTEIDMYLFIHAKENNHFVTKYVFKLCLFLCQKENLCLFFLHKIIHLLSF